MEIVKWLLILLVIILFFFLVILRIIRHFIHFPIPSFLTKLIDNPIRRRFIQKPNLIADRMELHQGMVVVEIGPGKGKQASKTLEEAGIVTNMNTIPGDADPFRPSGLRLGTPELTRLGMKESEMDYIADLIERVCIKQQDIESVKKLVKEFRKDFQEVKYCFKSKTKAYQYINIH